MNWKIVAGVPTIAVVAILATAGMASAQNWGCNGGCYPNAYAMGYGYAPGQNYGYGAYDSIPWNYRGGPHPR